MLCWSAPTTLVSYPGWERVHLSFHKRLVNPIFFANSDVAFQDLTPTPLVSVVMGLGSTVQLRQILGHNVTLNNVLSWASFVVTV